MTEVKFEAEPDFFAIYFDGEVHLFFVRAKFCAFTTYITAPGNYGVSLFLDGGMEILLQYSSRKIWEDVGKCLERIF